MFVVGFANELFEHLACWFVFQDFSETRLVKDLLLSSLNLMSQVPSLKDDCHLPFQRFKEMLSQLANQCQDQEICEAHEEFLRTFSFKQSS